MSSKTRNVAERPKHGRAECGLLPADEETAQPPHSGLAWHRAAPWRPAEPQLTLQTHPRWAWVPPSVMHPFERSRDDMGRELAWKAAPAHALALPFTPPSWGLIRTTVRLGSTSQGPAALLGHGSEVKKSGGICGKESCGWAVGSFHGAWVGPATYARSPEGGFNRVKVCARGAGGKPQTAGAQAEAKESLPSPAGLLGPPVGGPPMGALGLGRHFRSRGCGVRWGGCIREQAPQHSPQTPQGSQSFARDTHP